MTVPEVRVAVQLKVDPLTSEVSAIFVESPEQIDFDNGLFVTCGFGVKETIIESLPEHPFIAIIVTL